MRTSQTSSTVIVLTTLGADDNATELARTLVAERLAACVNVLPVMTSTYRWQGKVEQAQERQVVIKTSAGRVSDLEVRLQALHPYDVPEFLVLRVEDGSADYLEWVRASVTVD